MRTIFKILVIVVVAVLVGGLFYSVVTASSGTDQAAASERPLAARAGGEFNQRERTDGAGGIQFPADSIKNLMIISMVGLIYINMTKWLSRSHLKNVSLSDSEGSLP